MRITAIAKLATAAGLLAAVLPHGGADWQILKSPNPAGPPSAQLTAVACPTATFCVAVGSFSGGSGAVVELAEVWNGSNWSQSTLPKPTSASSALAGVACASASLCMAVGTYTKTSGTVESLAEKWGGTSWSLQTIAPPTGSKKSALTAVSCPSKLSCTAVGNDKSTATGDQLLAEQWNGTSWSAQSVVDPGDSFDTFVGVSCPALTMCIAVTSEGDIEQSAGTSWSVQSNPGPPGDSTLFAGVSCASTTSCVAVGAYFHGIGQPDFLFAESWDGAAWTYELPPNASTASDALSGVSCSTATTCTAVGSGDGNPETTIGEDWNGTSWSLETTANAAGGAGSGLAGVACSASSTCTAVGDSDVVQPAPEVTLAERYNGAWAIQPTINPSAAPADDLLQGVSCVTTSRCAAVGYDTDGAGTVVALAEGWNGVSWALQSIPLPADATASYLYSVACPSISLCIAVGGYTGSDGPETLVEQWNGTTWALDMSPNPTGLTQIDLYGVSCPTTSWCTAVGSYTDSDGNTLAMDEAWDGSTWTFQQRPLSAPDVEGDVVLFAISCPSVTMCMAVGRFTDDDHVEFTLSMYWDGTDWTYGEPPSGQNSSVLSGVSCPTTASCVAVGGDFTAQDFLSPLTVYWTATSSTWVSQSSPIPANATGVSLNGVSCASASSCVDAGSYSVAKVPTVHTLAETWSGSVWVSSTTANPAGTDNQLASVSCAPGSSCMAAGDTAGTATKTLIETNAG